MKLVVGFEIAVTTSALTGVSPLTWGLCHHAGTIEPGIVQSSAAEDLANFGGRVVAPQIPCWASFRNFVAADGTI